MGSVGILFVVLLQWVLLAHAHSWLDCVHVANPLVSRSLADMNCTAYPSNYQGRDNPDANMYKIEGITETQFLTYPACKVTPSVYTPTYPRLKLYAGQFMTIGYTPNGHTTWMVPPPPNGPRNFYIKWLPNKPAGTQMITISDMINATTLYTVQFDVPCHDRVTGAQLDPSSGLCNADIQVPADTPQGVYQFIWWWPFRFQGTTVEDYITCFDIEVVPAPATMTSTTNRVFPDLSTTGSHFTTTGSTSGVTATINGSSMVYVLLGCIITFLFL